MEFDSMYFKEIFESHYISSYVSQTSNWVLTWLTWLINSILLGTIGHGPLLKAYQRKKRNTCPKFNKKFAMKEFKLWNWALSESASSMCFEGLLPFFSLMNEFHYMLVYLDTNEKKHCAFADPKRFWAKKKRRNTRNYARLGEYL